MTWITDLPALAKAATPGPWEYRAGIHDDGTPNDFHSVVVPSETGTLADCYNYTSAQDEANARYLTALTPARILALVALYEEVATDVDLNPFDCAYGVVAALRALEQTP